MYGEKVKRLRVSLGLNQADFSNKLGLTAAALSKIENDITKHPRSSFFSKLVEIFNVNLDWIFNDKDEMFVQHKVSDSDASVDTYRRETIKTQMELSNVQRKLILAIEENKEMKHKYERKMREIVNYIKKGELTLEALINITFLDD